jgi:hypothetical protein
LSPIQHLHFTVLITGDQGLPERQRLLPNALMRLIVSTAAITCQIKSQDYHAGKTFPDGKLLVFNNATAYEIFSASFYIFGCKQPS